MSVRFALALILMASAAGAAHAQEVISNPTPAPAPVASGADAEVVSDVVLSTQDPEKRLQKEAAGAWAQRILDDAATGKTDEPKKACANPNPDQKAHGEVWAGIGTGGYKEYGAVVTQPIGDCSYLTVGFDQSQGGGGRGRGPRR